MVTGSPLLRLLAGISPPLNPPFSVQALRKAAVSLRPIATIDALFRHFGAFSAPLPTHPNLPPPLGYISYSHPRARARFFFLFASFFETMKPFSLLTNHSLSPCSAPSPAETHLSGGLKFPSFPFIISHQFLFITTSL